MDTYWKETRVKMSEQKLQLCDHQLEMYKSSLTI